MTCAAFCVKEKDTDAAAGGAGRKGFPGAQGEELACKCRGHGFHP